ncbi:MAG: TIGR00645 family protein [Flammeovirgaceae bacterium]|nr:TIGR00645 family protein [Flammeovirgaceae bacterium]MBE62559.1 TIGR00645 family protein [Flammeovirgaceae bacterium]MBR09031.1 TIGR00645 family protein [Rickettsiales bacterium]HCX23898.1 TIGR00645 family protein [Cytophagales bacterium]|tara:strand:+ start:602 stop:1192 length:591 start_codon:yes stop_codon:yes gene_type:complete
MAQDSGLKKFENFFEGFMFWSRWVQAPLYTGLILASFLYLFKFFQELFHLYHNTLEFDDNKMMLAILALVDISMVMNLVVMVTIGGYSIFTSRIDVDLHEDKPLWLEDLDAGQLKIKLSTSLASISGVQLLKTFINYREAGVKEDTESVVIEIVIHMVFIVSAFLLALTEKTTHSYKHGHHAAIKFADEDDEEEGH